MSELAAAIVVGFIALIVAFKILKLALKVAFLVALGAGIFAGYLAYTASDDAAAVGITGVLTAVVGW